MQTGLRIRVLEGQTVDGRREYEFPASPSHPEERIVIGRDPAFCNVAFVEELRLKGLGPEHVALRRSLGNYHLDLNTRHVVLLDGRSTFEEKELSGTHVLRLGDAATLEVTIVDERPATEGAARTEQFQEAAQRHRRLLAGLAATVAALAVGGWWYVRTVRQQAADEARAALAAFADIAPVSDSVISRVRESIYAIMLRSPDGGEAIIGSGWAAPGGKIVTNVHVVDVERNKDLKAMLDSGAEIFVRSAVPPHRSHKVTRRKPHPGYQRFITFMDGMRPLRKSLGGFQLLEANSACDVAILEVENPADLAPPLEIASPEDLRNLRSGQPIGMVGYPSEDLMPNDVTRPEPVSQKANIVRMTDFFMDHRDDGNNLLVQHSLPVAGGASGSPIFNEDGRVIGVITAINPVSLAADETGGGDAGGERRRIMNPAAVNFGQRADFVLDLLEGREEQATQAYEADWMKSLSRLDRLADQAIPLKQRMLSEVFRRSVSPRVIREFKGTAARPKVDDGLKDLAFEWLDIPRGLIGVLVVPESSVDLDVTLLDGSDPILESMDREVAYHGDILFANRFPRRIKLVAWTPPEHDGEPVRYRVTLIDWGIDPDEYIQYRSWNQARSAIRTDAPPARSFDLKPARLDSTVTIDGQEVVGREVSWKLPQPGICLVTCRPSRAAQIQIMVDGPDGLQPLSPLSEAPHAVVPCLTADAMNKLLILAPVANPDDKPFTVNVHVDAWTAADEGG